MLDVSDKRLVVVGAGAAGIFAAWRAAQLGARPILLEKTVRIGTKILVSGGGKCNITHAGPIEEVLKPFRKNEIQFLRPSFYRFTNEQVVDLLVERGLEVYTRPDGRIFPVHQTAKDVVQLLRQMLDEVGVEIRLNTPVTGIRSVDGCLDALETPEGWVECSHAVVSVGGSSFPNSGTTGDGWPWMRALGHSIVPLRAALAPVYLRLEWESPSGISLKQVVLKARASGKEVTRWHGDLLFTHEGLSGPCALGISRIVAEKMLEGAVSAELDLLPDLTFEELTEAFAEASRRHPHRTLANHLETQLPDRLVALLLGSAGAEPDRRLKDLDRKSRNRLIETLKGWDLGVVRAVPLEKGEVVAGGVALDEVDPHTMASKKVRGLYLCGEILDIAGPVGGYNLQAAWSGGWVAGDSAAKALLGL